MRLLSAMRSIQGRRNYQQDNCAFIQQGDCALLVVCDGNTGIEGDAISKIALKSSMAFFLEFSNKVQNAEITTDRYIKAVGLRMLRKAVAEAVFKKKHYGWIGGGTTVTAVLLTPFYTGTFWIGDSPAFIYHDEKIEHLITPHTQAEYLIAVEGYSREEISQQPAVNSLLRRCVGYKPCEPEAVINKTPDSCFVVVASDGLLLKDDEIIEILKAKDGSSMDMQEIADELVLKSYKNGSGDNISVIVAEYSEESKPTHKMRLTVIE